MAIPRQGQKGGDHLQQQLPRRVCLPLPPTCCPDLANPTLLQHFSLLKSRLSHTGVQAGGKTKGGAYLPARRLPGTGMLSAPASHLLHLHPSLCLHSSGSWGPGAPFHGLRRQWGARECLVGPNKPACSEQKQYLSPLQLPPLPSCQCCWFQRHSAGRPERPVGRKRREGCA